MLWARNLTTRKCFLQLPPLSTRVVCSARLFASQTAGSLPYLSAPSLRSAQCLEHVNQVAIQLRSKGILKISLAFSDPNTRYLENLIHSLHKHHGHQLPIAHSATRGWFWDVRPLPSDSNNVQKLARSETKEKFPWHTDCSYETCPPQYFALQILHADRYGGGTLSILDVQRLVERLSHTTRLALMKPDFMIQVPAEFIKQEPQRYIHDSLLALGSTNGSFVMRLRDDIVTPTNADAAKAFGELKQVLDSEMMVSQALHFPSEVLPTNSIVLIDNRLWLHSRSEINDPKRHLRRVRWNARSFP